MKVDAIASRERQAVTSVVANAQAATQPQGRRQIAREDSVENTLGPLKQYLDDPTVFELRINKYCQVVKVTTKGRILVDDPAIDKFYLQRLTATLLNYNDLDPAPVSDVKLPDGSRVVICWPPAVLEGTVLISIRKHLEVNKTVHELAAEGRFANISVRSHNDALTLEPFEQNMLDLMAQKRWPEFFEQAVLTHRNICVAGGTGSGKSTFHRSLLELVPATERVIILEDVHEVGSDKQHEIGYMMYGASKGRISAAACLKACMRLSPDRIFLTELRDDAAWNYLNSANTGHPGSIFSTHADSVLETPGRIADLVKASPVGNGLDYEMILRTINRTIDVIIYMKNWEVKQVYYDPMFKKKCAQFA
jgi:type IV secretion system protein VirB11